MRPVDKGTSPISGDFCKYEDALPYLIQRLGNYCSYCERSFEAGLSVEHICPKSTHEDLEKKWDNFLIACTQCNSSKGHRDIKPNELKEYVWPDTDDTYHMIDYPALKAYQAEPNNDLDEQTKQRVQKTIDLVNINYSTDVYGQTTYKNKLLKRQEVVKECKRLKNNYINAKELYDLRNIAPLNLQKNIEENFKSAIENIISAAKEYGCWSIWMKLFEEIPEIKEGLLKWDGTNVSYF